jgi:hypothetical protein
VKEEAVIVVASIARENVAVGATLVATPLAPLPGVAAVTVGAPIVVKLHVTAFASVTPSLAATLVSSWAV